MNRRNRLEFNFKEHSRVMWIQKNLISLWVAVSNSRDLATARKDMVLFVQDLPIHACRKETEEEFIMRHLYNEIETRSQRKCKEALNAYPPSYLSDYHIRTSVWDDRRRGSLGGRLGGFSNMSDGIYAVFFNDIPDEFIYHFHDRPVDPKDLHPNAYMMPVIYKDVVVFIEYSSVWFKTEEEIAKLIGWVVAAIRTRMGE